MLEAPIECDSAVFLPIKPRFVNEIVAGNKSVEFRKTEFQRNFSKIIIYASSPIKKIVAICNVKKIKKSSPNLLWQEYKNVAGIDYDEYCKYYLNNDLGIAIEFDNVRLLRNPRDIKFLCNTAFVPQSFMYVNYSKVTKLLGLPYSTVASAYDIQEYFNLV